MGTLWGGSWAHPYLGYTPVCISNWLGNLGPVTGSLWASSFFNLSDRKGVDSDLIENMTSSQRIYCVVTTGCSRCREKLGRGQRDLDLSPD